MKCPFCNVSDTQVVDSRVNEDGTSVRRRRRCPKCSKRFTTYETIELRLPQVVKQDGRRTEFSRKSPCGSTGVTQAHGASGES
jgi:transcriptional repressor NrdR